MNKKPFFVIPVFFFATLCFSVPSFSAGMADIAFVVDESGSMSGEHAWIPGMVNSLESDLLNNGVQPNRYGLTGFGTADHGGGPPHIPHQHNVGGGQFGTAAQLGTAASGLVANGGFEDGWRGLEFVLGYSYRPGAVRNIILITDEDRDNSTTLSYSQVLGDLNSNDAMLNAVVNARFEDGLGQSALGIDSDGFAYIENGSGGFIKTTGGIATSGFGSTISDYVDLALATGGAAWDLTQLRAGGQTAMSFTEAFVDIKSEEITRKVPEPGLLLLLGVGFSFIAFARRKQC